MLKSSFCLPSGSHCPIVFRYCSAKAERGWLGLHRPAKPACTGTDWDHTRREGPWCWAAARGGDTVVPGHCWHIGAPQGHEGCVQGGRNAQAALLNGLMVREKCTGVNEIKISISTCKTSHPPPSSGQQDRTNPLLKPAQALLCLSHWGICPVAISDKPRMFLVVCKEGRAPCEPAVCPHVPLILVSFHTLLHTRAKVVSAPV